MVKGFSLGAPGEGKCGGRNQKPPEPTPPEDLYDNPTHFEAPRWSPLKLGKSRGSTSSSTLLMDSSAKANAHSCASLVTTLISVMTKLPLANYDRAAFGSPFLSPITRNPARTSSMLRFQNGSEHLEGWAHDSNGPRN
ncbi:hypothetical protein I552_6778 [Mycobacterium xenopi 3993]|nr:hypothetical protein I552_6778 [Mycobacterium xenopi 3993]